jgi:hypothetical protein
MACEHNHLRFTDGHFTVKCIDCDQKWAGVDDGGAPAYTLKSQMPQSFRETRHDRYVLARTEKQQPLKTTTLKKQ